MANIPIQDQDQASYNQTYESRKVIDIALTSPTITNLTLTNANIWYSVTLQSTTKSWLAKVRGTVAAFDYDFTVAHSTYVSVNAGDSIAEDTNPGIIYFRSTTATAVIEFEEWE